MTGYSKQNSIKSQGVSYPDEPFSGCEERFDTGLLYVSKTHIKNGIQRSSKQLVVLDDLISKHLVLTPRGTETSNSKMLISWQFIQATSQHTTHEEIRLLPINYRKAVENGL